MLGDNYTPVWKKAVLLLNVSSEKDPVLILNDPIIDELRSSLIKDADTFLSISTRMILTGD